MKIYIDLHVEWISTFEKLNSYPNKIILERQILVATMFKKGAKLVSCGCANFFSKIYIYNESLYLIG